MELLWPECRIWHCFLLKLIWLSSFVLHLQHLSSLTEISKFSQIQHIIEHCSFCLLCTTWTIQFEPRKHIHEYVQNQNQYPEAKNQVLSSSQLWSCLFCHRKKWFVYRLVSLWRSLCANSLRWAFSTRCLIQIWPHITLSLAGFYCNISGFATIKTILVK